MHGDAAGARSCSMDEIVALFSVFQMRRRILCRLRRRQQLFDSELLPGHCAGLFGAVCLNHLAERRDILHLGFNVSLAMFVGGVIGNALLRGAYMPLGNDLLITATLALLGMSVMALVLLVTYVKTEI
jgi:hypothetical protein